MLKLVRIFFGHPGTLRPTSLCPISWHNILFVFICTGPCPIVANHFPNLQFQKHYSFYLTSLGPRISYYSKAG